MATKGRWKSFVSKLIKFMGIISITAGTTIGLVYSGNYAWQKYERYAITQAEVNFKATYLAPTVRIRISSKVGNNELTEIGSGVIVYSKDVANNGEYDTYVLTCNHVLETPPEATVRIMVDIFDPFTQRIKTVSAQIIARSPGGGYAKDSHLGVVTAAADKGKDLALLKLKSTTPWWTAKIMIPKETWRLKLNNEVVLVGCRLGDRPTHTRGQITVLYKNFLQINAIAFFGVSGGPCIDVSTGTVVGIFNAIQGSQNFPVTHLALGHPVFAIHEWLSSIGYAFLYE